ncbi:MAG: NADH-quinone oxidoreductase subunit J [Alphaproteobacteria bacterium MarineAlpha9_Bin3]|nr:MAG: NADH-quinone oxidoreductase subunit J [Alphaproteobacteria bacterium MarineAlpha9_Bin3]|tara:strand:+ start:10005 stop:10610 length:606 start_codon:yes stop_codon:yes gene_type:complete
MLPVFFYLFSIIAIFSAIMVITTKNPVHSVFFLILTFFNSTGLFVLMGAEFLAMLLLVVYVGAVAVLFLFVIMMLNIDFSSLRAGMIKNAPLGLLIGAVLLGEIIFSFIGMKYGISEIPGNELFVKLSEIENTRALGNVIYTDYIYLFQCAGLILLVAMIGAIVLTHRRRENVKKQDAVKQTLRDKSDSIEVSKVEIGKGV